MKIPIINDNNLLKELKSKFSSKASNVVIRATGIPPRTEAFITMFKLIQATAETLEEVKILTLNLRATESDKIDAKALKNS